MAVSSAVLPSYSTGEPPLYSHRLSCGEQSLQETPVRVRPPPSGSFVKKSGKATVTLFDQAEGAKIPLYGRNATIGGVLTLGHARRSRKILRVEMRVEGKLEVLTSEGGSKTTRLLSRRSTVWERESPADLSPDFFPLCIVLPSTSSIKGHERPLPPSYNVSYPGIPSLFVRSRYSVCLQITSIRKHTFDLLTKTKKIDIPFQYIPRTRAYRPIVYTSCFYSSVKMLPEEWFQVVTPVPPTQPNTHLVPLHCQFFIPASKIYGICDRIPFHIQLSGSLRSLKKFLMRPDTLATQSSRTSSLRSLTPPKINFKVLIVRQTRVETSDASVWRNAIIGTCDVQQVVPQFPNASAATDDDIVLDWNGDVTVSSDIVVGSFAVDDITVKDSVILSIEGYSQGRQPPSFLPVSITVPIRLVTDSYTEDIDWGTP